jgi:hypothetical protein
MVSMALLVLAAIALSLSTRLSTAPTMATCVVVLLTGLASTYWIGDKSGPLAFVVGALLPNWQHFWAADHLSAGGHVPLSLFLDAAAYAIVYAAAILCAGAISFRHAEVSSR